MTNPNGTSAISAKLHTISVQCAQHGAQALDANKVSADILALTVDLTLACGCKLRHRYDRVSQRNVFTYTIKGGNSGKEKAEAETATQAS